MSEITETEIKITKIEENKSSDKNSDNTTPKTGLRTKIFSLLLLALLIVPAILINPVKDNSAVLGVSENLESPAMLNQKSVENFNSINQNQKLTDQKTNDNFTLDGLFNTGEKAKVAKIGQIGSGAQEIKTVDKDESKSITGKVIWDENVRTGIATDKFPLGSSVKVNYNKKDSFLVVGDTRVLASDTVLVVNRDTFIKLGGNPDKENKVTVTISLDN
jgi:hypothetical protein